MKIKKSKASIIMKKSVAFFSPFSNGATTCAYHYTEALNKKYGASLSIAFVELDFLHPTFKTYYPESKSSFKRLLASENIGKLNIDMIKNVAYQTDYDVFSAHFSYLDLINLNVIHLKNVLHLIIASYDVVIFDTNRNIDNKATDIALEIADEIIMPLMPSEINLHLMNDYIDLIEDTQQWSTSKCNILINQYQSHHHTFAEIENIININVIDYISLLKHSKLKNMQKVFFKMIERQLKIKER